MADIINGSAIAEEFLAQLTRDISYHNIQPKLQIIIVGDNPSSQIYVRNKLNAAKKVGMSCAMLALPLHVQSHELLQHIQAFNQDQSIHGIIVQLPLPKHIDPISVINAIAPHKDVDCFHPINLGKLFVDGQSLLRPCTPSACLHILQYIETPLEGKRVAIIGRSNIVGKPLSIMLTNLNATVTLCHSKTQNLKEVVQEADIAVCAIGVPHFFDASFFKPGAIVLDVGISKVDDKIYGDVDTQDAMRVVDKITPVPKGVGPMTVAYLIRNTFAAALYQQDRSAMEEV